MTVYYGQGEPLPVLVEQYRGVTAGDFGEQFDINNPDLDLVDALWAAIGGNGSQDVYKLTFAAQSDSMKISKYTTGDPGNTVIGILMKKHMKLVLPGIMQERTFTLDIEIKGTNFLFGLCLGLLGRDGTSYYTLPQGIVCVDPGSAKFYQYLYDSGGSNTNLMFDPTSFSASLTGHVNQNQSILATYNPTSQYNLYTIVLTMSEAAGVIYLRAVLHINDIAVAQTPIISTADWSSAQVASATVRPYIVITDHASGSQAYLTQVRLR